MCDIRLCRVDERAAVLAIVNAAAEAYRGVIPPDRWHEPYMRREELDDEIAAGVLLWGYSGGGGLLGVMGLQAVRDVDLIRHAYVEPESQAIRFYERHGFRLVSPACKTVLLKTYWSIPEPQIETSVVLANPALDDCGTAADAIVA